MAAGEPVPAPESLPLDAEVLRIAQKVREVGRALDARYLDKAELVRLLLVTLVAGEHMLIVGPPGTAKSALVRHLASLIDARYFEYLLTRFSEPNEIFGPIDIQAFRQGTYVRRVEAMPEATWLMVLIAAAEPAGDPALLRKAAARLGLSPDAVVSA